MDFVGKRGANRVAKHAIRSKTVKKFFFFDIMSERKEKSILGGTFWVALLRNSIGAVMMMTVFLMLDHPRLPMRKTIFYYLIFGIIAVGSFSLWYVLDRNSYIRFSGLCSLPVVGIFCSLMSGEGIYLSLYKISLGFYLLSLCVFVGIDSARWWFEGNLWADIGIRLLMMTGIFWVMEKKFRRIFLANLGFLREEMDLFSSVTLVISFITAAFVAYWPNERVFSVLSIMRILVIMFLTGMIQFLIFHLYLHLGKEHCYKAERQLLELNEQLLRRQLEQEQRKKTEPTMCKNNAVDTILSAYAGFAKEEKIEVSMEVAVEENLSIRDIDLVAIVANIFENAIYGCLCSGAEKKEIGLSMIQKGHKIVIQCRNTCNPDVNLKKQRHGVASIAKTASRYDGETDFEIQDATFLIKVLLNVKEKTDVKSA